MSRTIIECPSCGEWEGPMDGEASQVIKRICEKCQTIACRRCGSTEVNTDEVDNVLCINCQAAENDRVYEELREVANG